MAEFVIYRNGWNKVNQDPGKGLPEKMAVARLEADSAENACKVAKTSSNLLDNQYLTAELAELVDAKEEIMNRKA